ncbi:MAG: GerW family sporulation protein [Lachnospiraceae bacterium]|nr:GerW family sporulation protein [Lachnospiraceae bacterium]
MMANDFNQTVGSLFQGMNSLLTTKTVVGEPTKIGDTIILPLVDVNFGVGAGAFAGKTNSAGGGMGGKMSPSAVLVIQNGKAKMVSVKGEDTVGKILDMVPDVVDKVANLVGKGNKNPEEEEQINKVIDELEEENI